MRNSKSTATTATLTATVPDGNGHDADLNDRQREALEAQRRREAAEVVAPTDPILTPATATPVVKPEPAMGGKVEAKPTSKKVGHAGPPDHLMRNWGFEPRNFEGDPQGAWDALQKKAGKKRGERIPEFPPSTATQSGKPANKFFEQTVKDLCSKCQKPTAVAGRTWIPKSRPFDRESLSKKIIAKLGDEAGKKASGKLWTEVHDKVTGKKFTQGRPYCGHCAHDMAKVLGLETGGPQGLFVRLSDIKAKSAGSREKRDSQDALAWLTDAEGPGRKVDHVNGTVVFGKSAGNTMADALAAAGVSRPSRDRRKSTPEAEKTVKPKGKLGKSEKGGGSKWTKFLN